uniref:DNA polymerase n=1 Tax=Rhabditophanes sp. KR3021 TaxID=114890 RepID=A0AC35U244_9BILA
MPPKRCHTGNENTKPAAKKGKKEVVEKDEPIKMETGTSIYKDWERPEVDEKFEEATCANQAIQVMDMDYIMRGPIVDTKLYGVNREGNSCCIHVQNYVTYCFIEAPAGYQEKHLVVTRNVINKHLLAVAKNYHVDQSLTKLCLNTELVKKKSVFGFDSAKEHDFIKVYLAAPRLCGAVNKICKHDHLDIMGNGHTPELNVFESNIDYEIRFMADINLVGCGWIELPEKKYTHTKVKQSDCQIEVDIDVADLIVHDVSEAEWGGVAPIRILSFDIECQGRKGTFPEADVDPIIQIGCMVKIEGEMEPFLKVIFCLHDTDNIMGSSVLSCRTEKELLHRFANFIQTVDPDIITGYNIQNFDFPYIIDRVKALKLGKEFLQYGRIKNVQTRYTDQRLGSKQMGTRVNKNIEIDGRVLFDVFQIVLRDYKLRSYSLNSVAYHFLKQQKEDVDHNIISDLQQGDSQTRRRLAVYCLKDAHLPLLLLQKLMSFINYMEMARVTGVPINFLLSRGQQVKILSQLIRRTKACNLILPVMEGQQNDEGYEGATVIEPKRGYYNEPITTLDFASLYPSIMIAKNICYTSFLRRVPEGWIENEDYVKSPTGNYFATKKHVDALLPDMLTNLLGARKDVKGMMKTETDPFKKMVLDGRQLALKISANSIYGFTGATQGKLPCLEISQSVTGYGRDMIQFTAKMVEETFKAGSFDGKCKVGATVVYGDTDSVMIKFGVKTVGEAMELGKIAALEITKSFDAPIKLEFEKVYCPFLLINKKRYAGLYFTKPDIHDKMDCKGLETIRRDNAPIVGTTLNACLEKLMINRSADEALAHAKTVISDLLMNRIDISLLIISKELSKKDYSNKQPHSELAERMKKRDIGSAPKLGDRVPYVITAKGKDAAVYEKAEDPLFVLKNSIPIDVQYYLEHQLAKPLARLFEPIIGKMAEEVLTKGQHTSQKWVAKVKSGGLFGILKKSYRCMSCKKVLKNKAAVCGDCEKEKASMYISRINTYNAVEHKYNALWTECQNCAGTEVEEVICSSKDCPIFYMREKVKIDLAELSEDMSRFEI